MGDFELAYRMHQRAGRAIKRVIEGKVKDTVRNEAIFRLARIYFRKDQPEDALHAVEQIRGAVPAGIRDDLEFLRAQIFLALGRFTDAAHILQGLQSAKSLEGFTTYNLGIALLRDGKDAGGASVPRPYRADHQRPPCHAGDQGQVEPGPRLQASG